jgi:poly(A) polymerase
MPSLLAHVHQLDDLIVLADAYVPVIKFKLRGVSVDLLCCCLDVSCVPATMNLTADAALLLARGDVKGLLALNGVRICRYLLEHTPHTARFVRLLRIVKLWACHRGLYGSTQQYLAGISWAILVAHYLKLTGPRSLLHQVQGFFALYCDWDWPKPVQLGEEPPVPFASLPSLPSWSQATSNSDAMPIITPCWPRMNSAHYVSDSTLRVLTHEMACAAAALLQFGEGQLEGGAPALPHILLRSPPVLSDAHVLLLVRVSAGSLPGFLAWKAFLATRLRLLCCLVEGASTPVCQLAARLWPFPLADSDGGEAGASASASLPGSDEEQWMPTRDMAHLSVAEDAMMNLQPAAFHETWAVAVTVHSAAEGPQKVDLTQAIRVFAEKLETWKAGHLAEHAQCGMVCVKTADAKLRLL